MDKQFTVEFFQWVDNLKGGVKDASQMLNKSSGTVANWRSIGIPKNSIPACKMVMHEDQVSQIKQARSNLVMQPTREQFNRWNQAALNRGQILEEWAFSVLEEAAETDLKESQTLVAEGSPNYNATTKPTGTSK